MLDSRTETIRFAKIIGIVLFVILILTFVFFRSLNYLRGPSIVIDSPKDGSVVSANFVEISGNAQRIVKINLNGYPIYIDEQGNWKEKLIIFQGLNKITVEVEDQFGRKINKQLDIIGKTNQ